MENQQFIIGDPVENHEFSYREAAKAWAKVVIAKPANKRIAREERETIAERLELAIRGGAASAVDRGVFPDAGKFSPCRRQEAIAHLATIRSCGKSLHAFGTDLVEQLIRFRLASYHVTFAACERGFRKINRGENFDPAALTFFP